MDKTINDKLINYNKKYRIGDLNMKTFNNIEELAPYYDKNHHAYIFDCNIKLNFNLIDAKSNIYCGDIHAGDIVINNIIATNIMAGNILAADITAGAVYAGYINAKNILVKNINCGDLKAIKIKANNIRGRNIEAYTIDATTVEYYAVCWAYEHFYCKHISGAFKNSHHFCLDENLMGGDK